MLKNNYHHQQLKLIAILRKEKNNNQTKQCLKNSPELIKNGIRKRPDSTRSRSDCNVEPSNGNAPQTSTYNTTPNDCLCSVINERK